MLAPKKKAAALGAAANHRERQPNYRASLVLSSLTPNFSAGFST